MYFAYVIKSISHDYLYKGHCKDVEIRLRQHNAGKTKSIKAYIPFKLVYCEKFVTEAEAIAREKYFKTAAGRKFIKNIFEKHLNLSEAPDPGSLPDCPHG